MEGFEGTRTIPFGVAAIDRCLPQGGLAGGGLHEFVPETGATPAALGLMVALLARVASPPPPREKFYAHGDDHARPRDHSARPPSRGGKGKIIFVLPTYGLRDYGRLHGHGVRALGLDPARLIVVETAHRNEILWALEEALHSGVPAAIAGVIDRLNLKSSQRLQLAAKDAGLPLFLLRPAQILEASAAATRWRVGAVPAARDRFGLFARARWHLMLERCRNGRAGEWVVEYDHVAHRFSLAAALADPAQPHGASETYFRQTG
jgi:protein ImuA